MFAPEARLRLQYANLHRREIAPGDIWFMAQSRIAWLWVWAVSLSVLYIQPTLPGLGWPHLVRGLINVIAGSAGQVIYLGLLWACARFGARFGLSRVHSPLLSLAAGIGASHVCAQLVILVIGHPLSNGLPLAAAYLFYFIVFEVQALFFGSVLLPRLLPQAQPERLRGESAAPAAPPALSDKKLVLAGRTLSRSEIIAVSAKGKFIEVMTTARTFTLRTTFSQALLRLAAVPGLQIHRSHWVADAYLRARRSAGGDKFVAVLDNGTELPISPNRIDIVDRWLADRDR